jgi:hypothetical protein
VLKSGEHYRLIAFSRAVPASLLSGLLMLCFAAMVRADQSKILTRPELSVTRRQELAGTLRQITGWNDLSFDEDGALLLGRTQPVGGSKSARELLRSAIAGKNLMVLEDASNRQDIVFCRVIEGRWKTEAAGRPPVYVILIDFADFNHLMGDEAALAAFNVGWGILHEIHHVVDDSTDATREGEAGECESFINQMRREIGLPERADYFFTFVPGTQGSGFKTKLVRIAFDQQKLQTKKKKRHWLVWDASLVGGVDEQKLLAARL